MIFANIAATNDSRRNYRCDLSHAAVATVNMNVDSHVNVGWNGRSLMKTVVSRGRRLLRHTSLRETVAVTVASTITDLNII